MRYLWNNLATHKNYIRNRPWCILGDFNVSLSADDKSTGPSYIDTGMRDFQDCVEAIEVSDVNSTDLRLTWNQNPKGEHGTLKNIDCIMANLDFYSSFVGSSAVFQPYRISDHSPAVLRIPMESTSNPRPFKFSNLLVHNNRFKDIVANGWNVSVSGFWMFKVVKRLKMLKKLLRKLLYDLGNLYEIVKKLRHELDMVQTALDLDPSNLELWEEDAVYLQAFKDASLLEENFLMQKSKVEWLKLGDTNTAYFHKVVKSQATRNRIDCVTTTNGVNVVGDQVLLDFIDHYSEFLGHQGVTSHLNSTNLFCNKLTSNVANYMVRDVFDQEICEAMFVMGDNKAPGLDGYTTTFFKKRGKFLQLM
ncbi:RNA-directed DNA polymerase, eukaryota, reverse transcriptase zinc-binding domain protein [Tanacetum coccineum]